MAVKEVEQKLRLRQCFKHDNRKDVIPEACDSEISRAQLQTCHRKLCEGGRRRFSFRL